VFEQDTPQNIQVTKSDGERSLALEQTNSCDCRYAHSGS
jgi:hypothetical protein